jgi:SAM-dependent methyltransferase
VVAADLDAGALRQVAGMADAMLDAGEIAAGGELVAIRADALQLPFADRSFEVVIASEVLEHIPEDAGAMGEIARVMVPGGIAAVSVPRAGPERVCWALSDEYHSNSGGHVRIYRGDELLRRLRQAGLEPRQIAHAHALHSPFWWLKCAVGVRRDEATLPRLYHRFLVWEMIHRPPATRWLEAALNPLIGKSLVVYLEKPAAGERLAAA